MKVKRIKGTNVEVPTECWQPARKLIYPFQLKLLVPTVFCNAFLPLSFLQILAFKIFLVLIMIPL
jgi:hypothetical protein